MQLASLIGEYSSIVVPQPKEKNELPKEDGSGHVKILISSEILTLMKQLQQPMETKSLEKLKEKIKKSVQKHCEALELWTRDDIPQQLLSIFEGNKTISESLERNTKIKLDWEGIVLKLHQCILNDQALSTLVDDFLFPQEAQEQQKKEKQKQKERKKKQHEEENITLLKESTPFVPIQAKAEVETVSSSATKVFSEPSSLDEKKWKFEIPENVPLMSTSGPSFDLPKASSFKETTKPTFTAQPSPPTQITGGLSQSVPAFPRDNMFLASNQSTFSQLSKMPPSSFFNSENTVQSSSQKNLSATSPFSSSSSNYPPVETFRFGTSPSPHESRTRSYANPFMEDSYGSSDRLHFYPEEPTSPERMQPYSSMGDLSNPFSPQSKRRLGTSSRSNSYLGFVPSGNAVFSLEGSSLEYPNENFESLKSKSSSYKSPGFLGSASSLHIPQEVAFEEEKEQEPQELPQDVPYPDSVKVLLPSSAYKKEKTLSNLFQEASKFEHAPEKVSFPDWLCFVVFWGTPQENELPKGIHLPLDILLLVFNSCGHYDFKFELFTRYTTQQLVKKEIEQEKNANILILKKFIREYDQLSQDNNGSKHLKADFKYLRRSRWSESRYRQYAEDIISSRESEFELEQTLNKLKTDVILHTHTCHKASLENIEKFLITMLGDDRDICRETAVKMLNVLYDGHDWQEEESLKTSIRTVGDSFEVRLDLGSSSTFDDPLYLLVYSPSQRIESEKYVLSRYKPEREGDSFVVKNLPNFFRAGYYDWRFVTVSSNGKLVPFFNTGLSLEQIQGRVIVQPKVRSEMIHEVWVELQGSEWDRFTGEIHKRGNLANIINALPEYKQYGVTTLYVMGMLERTMVPWSRPFSPVDRSSPNKWLDENAQFEELVQKAQKEYGIKVVVDCISRVSSRNANRKYRNLMCYTLNENEHLIPHPGTDGRDFEWTDSVLLNYRKKETWDLMIQEIEEWIKRGVHGVHLDSAHSWPLILRPDMEHLLKVDNDGEYHYSLDEIAEGYVVLPRKDEGMNFGYFGTEAFKHLHYPNPFFAKMTREIWKKHPSFMFLAEIHWDREKMAINSGLIPLASGLARAVSASFNLGTHKDGSLSLIGEQNVSSFYDWYQTRDAFPQGSILINPSSSHHRSYPTSSFGPGAWAAVDLLYFLPEIPYTYIGEQWGWMLNADSTHNRFVSPGIFQSRDSLFQIKGHYEHRSKLRNSFTVLREGGLIPLFALYGPSKWHNRVFTFARFSKSDSPELAVIAINFNEANSIFYIDCTPLEKYVSSSQDLIFRVDDLINPSNTQYFTPTEFLKEIHFIQLAPYSTICWGVCVQGMSSDGERVLYEQSMERLKRNLENNVDPSHNMIYSILIDGLSSNVPSFCKAIKTINEKVAPGRESEFPGFLHSVLRSLSSVEQQQEAKIMAYLQNIVNKSNDTLLQNICKKVLEANQLGPIVFVTPELGRFSTVGGIGVMVNELTQALAALGCEIHVVSPYYNYNRKGKTNYLKDEGILYDRNVSISWTGHSRIEVGVHHGKEHGVHLHFIHNYKYFSTPYHMGSPQHQLETIVLMAKASLETLCQLRLIPSVCVTNDWFTGLIPAYAKKSNAFGSTFYGTTFFHLVHNLEEGYEGKIYPDDEDFSYIHQLSNDLIMDYSGHEPCINSSKCVLLSCDQWGTVSTSYKNDLMRVSPLGYLLRRFERPFAILNGVRKEERLKLLKSLSPNHETAKETLQKKYFGFVDPSIPVFSFVGRIVLQKGVHLILNAVKELIHSTGGKIQLIVGGMANNRDPYAAQCAWSIHGLRREYPKQFWGDPNEFFTDGPLLNLGSDFALMPSLFEPSGVVQQEYFCGGTPVIAFKTGGLKDSIFEWNPHEKTGNGFTFEAHAHIDFVQAVHRSLNVFYNQEDYKKLRQNCFESIWDVTNVATGWLKEYCRLRKIMWVHPDEISKYEKENASQFEDEEKSFDKSSIEHANELERKNRENQS